MSAKTGGHKSFLEYVALAKEEFRSVQTAHPELARLSKREFEVFTHLLSDKTQSDIARELSVSASSVHFHCKNIYRKLEASGRRQIMLRYKDLLE